MKYFIHGCSSLAAIIMAVHPSLSFGQATVAAQDPVAYGQVQPVFKKHCVSCHGVERERGGLNLASTDGIKAGSSSGPVALPGKPDESLLYTLPAHIETPRMPPGKAKIPQRELDLIRSWIEGGMLEHTKNETAAVSSKLRSTVRNNQTPKPSQNELLIVAVNPLPQRTPITALTVSPTNGTVAVSGTRQVVLFPSTPGQPTKAFPFPEGDIFALRFSRDGEWLLAGGGTGAESGKVVAFEASTGRRLFEVGNESDVVLTFDISADRSLIALGGPSRVVKIYRTADGQLVNTLGKHTDWILSLTFSHDGLLLASSDRFGGLQVWEARTGKPFYSLRGHTGAVNATAWSSDSDKLLSAGQDGMLRIWDMHQGTPLKQWNAEVGGILSVEWLGTGTIVAGGRNKRVGVFDAAGQHLRDWVQPDEVVEIAATTDGHHVITGDAAGNLSKWVVDSGEAAGSFVIPLESQAVRVEAPIASRKPRSSRRSPPVAIPDVDRELVEAREALAATEAAVKAMEDSLVKLKESASVLRQLISSREAAANQSSANQNAVRSQIPPVDGAP